MSSGRLEDVKVLIVDDDRDVRESMDAAFQAEGAMTLTAGDGNTAVRVCQEDPPDLVVLDMMLPGRSGFLALEKIKGREDSPLVIMVTANDGKRHQDYAEALGVDKYLQKPVPLRVLLDTAVELLDKQDAEDEE
jgi:DNA-binding response OmpR family regulator